MVETRVITREEVAQHVAKDDQWLILEDQVYDISSFHKRHPGGRVISYYKGQDATEPITAFHPDKVQLAKWLKPLHVGSLDPISYKKMPPVVSEFRKLRSELEKEGKYKADPWFYLLHLAHIVLLEILAVIVVWKYGASFWSLFLSSVLLGTAQAQAGWSQHDYGHFSVFQKRGKVNLDYLMQQFTIGFLKGASAEWWNTRHNRHHAKTNVLYLDPDLHTEPVFIWNESLFKRAWRLLPYQQYYWWLIGPPLVTTVVFVFQNIAYIIRHRCVADFFALGLYYVRFALTFYQFMSPMQCIALYFAARFWVSHWFTWVTSMSHLARPMSLDRQDNWISGNAVTSQNITSDFFHDWFTGHLNFQLEHHLFPNMPRHHLPEIAPRIKALCKKHNIPYHVKSMYECCCDIIGTLAIVGKKFEKQYLTK